MQLLSVTVSKKDKNLWKNIKSLNTILTFDWLESNNRWQQTTE